MEARLSDARRQSFAAHAEDPRPSPASDTPYAVHYHARLEHWVRHFMPEASEALWLAAWTQHIERWRCPRSDYPDGRDGYKAWRRAQTDFHVARARALFAPLGFSEALLDRMAAHHRKLFLRRDPEAQALQDAVTMVFIEDDLTRLLDAYPSEKMAGILEKTWRKLSPAGVAAAKTWVQAAPESVRAKLRQAGL